MNKKDNFRFQTWQQSTDYSCGAACLMVALNELINFEMSKEIEIKIWKQVHTLCYQGSLPGYICIYAKNFGIETEIYYFPSKIKQILKNIPSFYSNLYRLLLFVNWTVLIKAKFKKIKINRLNKENNDLDLISNKLLNNKFYRIISVIEVENYELHYILLRADQNQNIVVMNPAYGFNEIYDYEEIKKYQDSSIGFHILLRLPRAD